MAKNSKTKIPPVYFIKKKIIIAFILLFFFNQAFIFCYADNIDGKTDCLGLGEMLKDNKIRVLVPYSKTFYFMDGAVQRGLTYEALKLFENFINNKFNRKTVKIKVVIIPTRRDKLIDNLLKGYGDIAAGNLTITKERLGKVDFSDPIIKGVSEIVVAGKNYNVDSYEDLNLYIRKSSSYYESVENLNSRLKKLSRKQIKVTEANELLEDEDILEMIHADIVPMTVMDSHKAKFWQKLFPELDFLYDIKIRDNARIAWAVRKNSKSLLKVLNEFIRKNGQGTYNGNVLYNKYLKNNKWVTNPTQTESLRRLEIAAPFFRKYSDQYDLDWLFLAAVAYQESGINQAARSPVGAVGVMQVLPSTASGPPISIENIYFIGNNINAGAKYLKYLSERYVDGKGVDKLNLMLFTLAAYNAGPGRLRSLRRAAEAAGYDPNKWFQNVEVIAAQKIGNETVKYVSNIYKYYIAYLLMFDKFKQRLQFKERIKKAKS